MEWNENDAALKEFVAAANGIPEAAWDQPVAPGKWTPGQITEHVALTYELGARVLEDEKAMPGVPRLLRPILRGLFLKRMLRTGKFPPKAKAPAIFCPAPATPARAAALKRLRDAVAGFRTAVEAAAGGGKTTFVHPVFGKTPFDAYVRIQALHAQHHRAQLPR